MVKKVSIKNNVKVIKKGTATVPKASEEIDESLHSASWPQKKVSKLQDFDNLGDSWTPPFYMRYRIATGLGILLSILWLWLSLDFINKVSQIAEDENHHPDLKFGWGYANIIISTHAINGLAESDFVLAAKIDEVSV